MAAYQADGSVGRVAGRLERLMYRHERWMYRGSAPNRVAAALNAIWAMVGATGLGRDRLIALEVAGRRTGRATTVPLIVADVDDHRYVVSMLGERADWVANVRAAGGRAVLRHGRRDPVRLEEVGPARRGPIVRRHLAVAPAARSFIPLAAASDPAAFEAYARQLPVFRIEPTRDGSDAGPTDVRGNAPGDRTGPAAPRLASLGDPGPRATGERPHRRSRRRWVVAIGALTAVAILAAVVIAATRSGPPPLALPSTAAQSPAGPLDGHWTAGAGSVAGFRIAQVLLGLRADVVGRTTDVTGTADVAGGRVAAATFTVDLTTITVNDKVPEQVAISLGTPDHPTATVELAQPMLLPDGFAGGATVTATAAARLTMHGVTHDVTISLDMRRDGAAIEVAGSMPIVLADWGVDGPTGYGALGSLDDRGVAELYLVLQRDGH